MRKIFSLVITAIILVTLCLSSAITGMASEGSPYVYEVGPEKQFQSLHEVPWGSLMPGDTVKIYWREEPYREKFCVSRAGTENAPITITGVPGPDGQLPVISGENATVSPNYRFWNDNRAVVKIGGASYPGNMSNPANGILPRYIIIENLDITSGRQPYTYTNHNGATTSHSTNAAALFIEYGENIIIRNNIIRDSANGLFVASGDVGQSRDILVQGNYIYDNGRENSIREHNVYTAAINIIFEFNYLGPNRINTGGNNLKDRSAGLVVRYNWIEGGNRALDITEGDDTELIWKHPLHSETYVYGNVMIDIGQGANRSMVHYGGDNGITERYKKGTLYFYNNTMIHLRPGIQQIFQIETDDESVDARNNIFYMTGDNTALVNGRTGKFFLSNNWINDGYKISINPDDAAAVDITMVNTIVGEDLNFVDMENYDFRLLPGSSCVNAGTELHPAAISAGYNVLYQYIKHFKGELRPESKNGNNGSSSSPLDIGAYELPSGVELGKYLQMLNKN